MLNESAPHQIRLDYSQHLVHQSKEKLNFYKIIRVLQNLAVETLEQCEVSMNKIIGRLVKSERFDALECCTTTYRTLTAFSLNFIFL